MQKRIFRTDKSKGGFTQYDNHIWETELSKDAKLYWLYLLSRVDSWEPNYKNVMKVCGVSDKTAKKVLNELIAAGYITRERVRNEKGQLHWDTQFFEHPNLKPEPRCNNYTSEPRGNEYTSDKSEEKEPRGNEYTLDETQLPQGFSPFDEIDSTEENRGVTNRGVIEPTWAELHSNNIKDLNNINSKKIREWGSNTIYPYIDKNIEIVEQPKKEPSPIITENVVELISKLRQQKTEEQGEGDSIHSLNKSNSKKHPAVKKSIEEQKAEALKLEAAKKAEREQKQKRELTVDIFKICANQAIPISQEWVGIFVDMEWDRIKTDVKNVKKWAEAAIKRHSEEHYVPNLRKSDVRNIKTGELLH